MTITCLNKVSLTLLIKAKTFLGNEFQSWGSTTEKALVLGPDQTNLAMSWDPVSSITLNMRLNSELCCYTFYDRFHRSVFFIIYSSVLCLFNQNLEIPLCLVSLLGGVLVDKHTDANNIFQLMLNVLLLRTHYPRKILKEAFQNSWPLYHLLVLKHSSDI